MKMRKNEQGYALLIVLFLVVFIMSVSSVFMRGAISNAKQEQIVDTNNMAVVAAEMGIKYYVNDIKNEENRIFKYVQSEMKKKVICNKENKPKGCETLDKIKQNAKDEYRKEFDKLIASYVLKIGTLRNDINPLDIKMTYKLFSFKKIIGSEDITIEVGVKGTSSSNDENLTAIINYKVPEVTGGGNGTGFPTIPPVTDPSIVFDYLKPDNARKEDPCPGNGACKGSGETYFTSGDIDYNNPNKMENFTWFHKGKLNPKNNIHFFSI